MPNITLKRTGALLRKLFAILIQAPEGMPAGHALAKVAEGEPMSEYEAGAYEQRGRRFEIIIRWATVDCAKAGWLLKHRGSWSVTDAGKEAYERLREPEAFYREAMRLYREWKAAQLGDGIVPTSPDPEAEDVEKSTSITYEQADEQAWGEIEAHVSSMKCRSSWRTC